MERVCFFNIVLILVSLNVELLFLKEMVVLEIIMFRILLMIGRLCNMENLMFLRNWWRVNELFLFLNVRVLGIFGFGKENVVLYVNLLNINNVIFVFVYYWWYLYCSRKVVFCMVNFFLIIEYCGIKRDREKDLIVCFW